MPSTADPMTDLRPAAVASGPAGSRRIDLFLSSAGLGRDGRPNLWHRWWTENEGWSGEWVQRGGCWTSGLVAVTGTDDAVHLFGLGSDGRLWHTWNSGGSVWPGEAIGAPIGRTIVSSPAAVSCGAEFLVSVRTVRDSDQRAGIWHAMLEGGGWRWRPRLRPGWPATPGDLTSGLGLSAGRSSRLDLFAVDGGGHLRHDWSEGEKVGQWAAAPGSHGLTSTPAAISWPSGVIHAVCCYGPFDLDPGRVDLISWAGRRWTEQRSIYVAAGTTGGVIIGPPVIASAGPPRLDVFFLTAASPLSLVDISVRHAWSADAGESWSFERLTAPPVFT